DVSGADSQFAAPQGRVERHPAVAQEGLGPHVTAEGREGLDIDQADGDLRGNVAGSQHGGQQDGVFGAIALQRAGDFGGRAEGGRKILFLDLAVDILFHRDGDLRRLDQVAGRAVDVVEHLAIVRLQELRVREVLPIDTGAAIAGTGPQAAYGDLAFV